MLKTENLGLNKPESTDFYNFEDMNENMDIIDEEIGAIPDLVDAQMNSFGSYFNNVVKYAVADKAEYEEGTWTPVLKSYENSDTTGFEVSDGYYVRKGDTVWVSFKVNLPNVDTIPAFMLDNNSLPYAYDTTKRRRRNVEVVDIGMFGVMRQDAVKTMADIRRNELTYLGDKSLDSSRNMPVRISFEYNIDN